MFLRTTKRKKDGKIHHYWSVVENVRVGRRVFQRRALYLGELNDSQHAEWQRAIEAIDDNGRVTQLRLFPEERAPESGDGNTVRIQMNRLSVRNMRNWGEVWLGLQLWDMLELDCFWSSRIDKSRKGTDCLALLKAIVVYRLTAPGSELQMHERRLKDCAAEELFGPGVLTGRSTLYNCLDKVLFPHEEWKRSRNERTLSFKDDLFFHLRDRWAGLFGSTCDVVLFDLASTYFEVDGIKALESNLQRYLDKRIGRSKWRTIEASDRKLTRDELVRRLAVAESKAGRAWKMISISIPGEGEDVTLDSFTWHLDWAKIREARRNDEGTYLLRTNLTDCDPKTLWKKYMIQGEIEYAFREMKHDLGLRPVYHQLDDRMEAHIFTSFMAFCLLTTLRAMAREHAPGLTPRQIIANLKTIKMVDVVMPTTDGRVVTLPRHVEPKEDVALLINRFGLTLPDQPPPKISESPSAT